MATGWRVVKEIKELQPETEVILLTAHGNIPDGVQAIKNGAFDYITKGDDNNKIIPINQPCYGENQQRPVQLREVLSCRFVNRPSTLSWDIREVCSK